MALIEQHSLSISTIPLNFMVPFCYYLIYQSLVLPTSRFTRYVCIFVRTHSFVSQVTNIVHFLPLCPVMWQIAHKIQNHICFDRVIHFKEN